MPAFVFAGIQSVRNPAMFAEYQVLAESTVFQFGGKFLGGGTKIEIADGDWSPVGVMAAERALLWLTTTKPPPSPPWNRTTNFAPKQNPRRRWHAPKSRSSRALANCYRLK